MDNLYSKIKDSLKGLGLDVRIDEEENKLCIDGEEESLYIKDFEDNKALLSYLSLDVYRAKKTFRISDDFPEKINDWITKLMEIEDSKNRLPLLQKKVNHSDALKICFFLAERMNHNLKGQYKGQCCCNLS